jgi:hypothetical protein
MKVTRDTWFKLAVAVSIIPLSKKSMKEAKKYPLLQKTFSEIKTEEEAQEAFNLYMDIAMEDF